MGRDVVTRLPLQRVQGRPTAPTTASKGENNGRTRVHVAMDTYTLLWTHTNIMDIHDIMDIHNDQWMLQSITQICTTCTSYYILIHFSIHTCGTK